MTLTSYRYKLQFVYDIINGKQSIADARKIFSDEWAAFYGLYVNISTAEQKLGELDTFIHGMNACSIQITQMVQKFFETQAVEIHNKLWAFLWQSFFVPEDCEEYYGEDCEEYYGEESLDIPTLYHNEELISYIKKDISVKCIAHLIIRRKPEDAQMARYVYFKNLNYMERDPYIRRIKRDAFDAFLKEHKFI